ncbi:ABC transporter substrate-binding protein [Paenibacillus sp. BIHB 4019]|uniref:ABC transporter substrate-binding protein n=1 Tax=Paenibacillus sp. BIHB 4019 TaxID=1870819 RepID=A0A1B2DKG5_9BACL|nr:ABC transporter substrate-binding protein [Paenibacillus sp. BIHB 4019]ANY68214.1 ABC transporter substrate-binding protein [Paenibacillus sp. BIHB 4019]
MNSKRKWLSLTLSAALLVGLLAGCSGNNKEGNTGNNVNTGNIEGESLDSITFSLYSADESPNWQKMQDAVGKEITKATGVTLDGEFAVGDSSQKISLIAASGEYPDMINPKGELSKLVEAGAMLDLTDLIEKHAPNIKKMFGDEMKRLRYSNEDKAIYVIPTYSAAGGGPFETDGGFKLQHRVVKELGYPKIETVQDFENAIKAYLEKHPTDENGNPNIGLTLNADDWRILISVTNPAFWATGAPDDGEYNINIETQEVIYHYRRPEEKEYFRWLNHMYLEGLLDSNSFVQKYDQYKAKIASGRVLGLIDQVWDYADAENALKAEGKLEYGYGRYPVALSDKYKDGSLWPTGFMAGWGIGITVDNPDPVRAIKFLDYLASEEGQILLNWGVEGQHYNVENGKRVIPTVVNDKKKNDPTGFQKESGIGFYTYLGARYGDGVLDSTGNYYTTNFPDQIIASQNEAEKETLAAYGVKTWLELFPQPKEFPVRPWGAAWNITVPADSETNVLQERMMRDITWKRIPQAIMAKEGEFDAIWDTYQKDLIDAGVEKMETGYEALVKERVSLWND